MILRLTTVLVGLALALLAATAVTQLSSEGEARKTVEIEPVATTRINFDCYIPRTGFDQCGRRFFVEPGRTLKVRVNASSGKRIDFNAYDVDTDQRLGETAYVSEGETETLFTNRSGRTRYVVVEAASPAPVAVRAFGTYFR
jgi:hypothetical protein